MIIDSKRLGLAGGILMAFCMLIMSIFAINSVDGCIMIPMTMMPIEMTGSGVIIGIIASFIHGFVALFLLGWLYNRLPHSKKR